MRTRIRFVSPVPGLAAGTYDLWAWAMGRLHPGKEVRVSAGGTAQVELKMWARESATVAGRVLLPDGRTPAPRASVVLVNRSGYATEPVRTDPEGQFKLVADPSERLRAVARKVGYGRAVSGWLTLPPGSVRRDLTLTLTEAGALSGQIVWVDGPEEEAVVVVAPADQPLAGIDLRQQGEFSIPFLCRRARPDRDGRFTLTDVTPGPNTLAVFVEGRPRLVRKEVIVPAGGTLEGMVLNLPPARGRLAGRVLEADGDAPLPGATLTLFNEALGLHRLQTQTDDQGCYTFSGIPAGTYQLLVSAPERASQVSAEFQVGEEPMFGLDFRLSAGGRVTGMVRGPNGEPIVGASVSTSPIPWVAPLPVGLSVRFASVREDGTYTLEHLAPGEYTLSVSVPGYPEMVLKHVVVREGETTAGVDWTLTAEEEGGGRQEGNHNG